MIRLYFLTTEEKRWVLKGLLPRARANAVTDELRGWNWPYPPLAPSSEVPLAVYEVAGRYCATGRDLYLRRVAHVKAQPNDEMAAGSFYHAVVTAAMVEAKRLIYTLGPGGSSEAVAKIRGLADDGNGFWDRLTGSPAGAPESASTSGPPGGSRRRPTPEVLTNGRRLASFEGSRLASRLEEALASQPHSGEDSLAATVVPVITEQRLNGTFLGLSPHLSTDALYVGESMIVDLKFGRPEEFHRLTTTGYALVQESLSEHPIDLGCIVYCEFKGGKLAITRDIHIISDELRQWFIEERDQKATMVRDQWDPGVGVGVGCRNNCPFRAQCKEDVPPLEKQKPAEAGDANGTVEGRGTSHAESKGADVKEKASTRSRRVRKNTSVVA